MSWVTHLGLSLTVYHTTSPGHTKQPGSRSMTHAHYTVGYRSPRMAWVTAYNLSSYSLCCFFFFFFFFCFLFFFKIVSSSFGNKLSQKLYQYLQLKGRQLFLKVNTCSVLYSTTEKTLALYSTVQVYILAQYSTSESRALYSAIRSIFSSIFIIDPNILFYIQPSRSIFSSILKI